MIRVRSNPYSITACSYSQDGNILIYSKGYNWNFVDDFSIFYLIGISWNNQDFIQVSL